MANGGRTPELSIKVAIDPVIDRDKLQGDINKLIPESKPIEINASVNAETILKSISEWQTKNNHKVPIVAELDKPEKVLDVLKNEKTSLNGVTLGETSLNKIRDQLQNIFDDVIKTNTNVVGGVKSNKKNSVPQSTKIEAAAKSDTKNTTDVTGNVKKFVVNENAIGELNAKIKNDLGAIDITSFSVGPETLKKLNDDIRTGLGTISVDISAVKTKKQPEVEQLSFLPAEPELSTAKKPVTKKSSVSISEDKILEQMANAQAKAIASEQAEIAAAKQRDIIYQSIVDHQAKAAEEANNATTNTAKGLSDANKSMNDLNAKAEKFEQNWREVVSLIAGATNNLADLMVGYYGASKGKPGRGIDVFGAFQEFDAELPELNTDNQKEYLEKIQNWAKSLLDATSGEFDPSVLQQAVHMFSGLTDAQSQIDQSKLTDMVTKQSKKAELFDQMKQLQNIFPASNSGDPFMGAKESAINYLVDLLGKAAKYYEEVGSAAKQTAQNIATANQGFANQTAQLEQTNAELEKAKQNETVVEAGSIPTKVSGEITITDKDIVKPEYVDFKGRATIALEDIKVPDKIDLNGNLVIKNATKEIKAATKEAEAAVEKETSKSSKKDDEKEKERKRKEYLLSLSSLLKKIATAENKLDEMYPGAENYNELQGYIENSLKRRKSTTEDLLNNLVGSSDWQNDALYTSGVEDAQHIRASKAADDKVVESIKNGIREEREYVATLKQIPDLEEAAAKALADFGDKSETYRVANKNLVDAKNTIIEFQEKYGESYSDLIRSEILEQQQSEKLMAKEKADKAALASQQKADNAKRIADEKKYLTALAQEPDLYQEAERARKKYGDTSQHYQNAQEDYDKSHTVITDFESDARAHHRSLSDIDGYNDVVNANQRKWLTQNEDTQLAYAAQRKKDAENIQKQQDSYVDSVVKNYGKIEKLQERKVSLFKPEQAKDLSKIDDEIKEINKDIAQTYAEAKNNGYDLTQNSDVKSAIKSLRNTKKVSKAEFTQNQQDYDLKYTIDTAKGSYIENFKKKRENEDYLSRIDQNDPKAAQMEKQYKQWIQENETAIQQAAQTLNSCHAAANDAWKEIQEVVNSSNIKDTEAANKAADAALKKNEADAKKAAADAKKRETEDTQFFSQLNQAVNAKLRTYKAFLEAEREDPTKKSKNYIAAEGNFNDADTNFAVAVQNAVNSGLNTDSRFDNAMDRHNRNMDAIGEASDKRAKAEAEAVKVTEEDITAVQKLEDTLDGVKNRIRNAGGTNTDEYNNAVTAQSKIQELRSRLEAELQKPGSDKNAIAVQWASENDINNVKSLDEVVQRLANDVSHLNSEGGKISSNKSLERSTYKAKTELANLQSQLHDYLKKSPGVESGMAEEVQALQRALADPSAYKNVAALKQQFAELRAQAKAAGLETESLIDKFKNLFGQHFSTMITMAALHQMQNALQVVYQNVVQIDTAMSELRKVSNMTASEMEKYMDRATESAQKLGTSISDYISSTADWKRLGYSDEDAENMATYSTLLKNVGDQIDDVNTSSSYLISTLQGFGLLAEDAEDVVNKIDAVANTQPVTAEAIGEILTRSSAAMASANNTLSETIALGTTAYSVLQNAESTGTLLKTLSMYLRAAKSDLEDAGESAEGCANSVSELRSELKSLTGVDIMIDNKNFKSTYQIMKELSEVWGNLSDVTQANVTEMIGGKVYPYVQQCA